MPTVYSHSRLSVFEGCRLRYRLKYVDRVRRDLEGVEAFLGSRVHECLESLYRDAGMGRATPLEALLADYHRRWDAEWTPAVVVSSDRYRPADYRAVGEDCLRRYFARHAPFRADQTLGVEVRIGVDLPGGARLEGYADRVARDPDGWISIHDYKTSSALPTQADVDQDRQLALYQAGVENLWPGAPGMRLVWHYLRFDERLVSVRSREQQAALLHDTAHLVAQVESERDWKPTVTPLCGWCPYWDLCPEKKHDWLAGLAPWKGPAEGDGLFQDHAQKDRGEAASAVTALADAVNALRSRGTANAALDEAKQRLIDYARSTGALRVESPLGTARIRLGDEPEVRITPRRGS